MAKPKAERQAERAEKKAARQAQKAEKAIRSRNAFLQLPAEITAGQRARIHAAAEAAGLEHESSGEAPHRILCVGNPACDLETCPDGAMDDEALQDLLFERLGLVLLPSGAAAARHKHTNESQSKAEPTLEEFITQTRSLLDLEESAEVEQAESELSNFSAQGAQAAGRSLLGLRCEEASSGFLGKTLLTLVRNKGSPGGHAGPSPSSSAAPAATSTLPPLPAHRFTPHDVVALRPNSPYEGAGRKSGGAGDAVAQGVVYRVYEDRIVVAVDDVDDSASLDSPLRLDKLANKVTYERLAGVLRELESDTEAPGRPLLDVAFPPTARAPVFANAAPSWTPVASRTLDASQRAAVALALASHDVALIHGPPGTGKTTALVEVILALAAAGVRVLYCAASNVAVDNAVERLAAAAPARVRARLVRLGHPARLLPEVLEHSLEAAVLRTDASALAADCRAEAAALGRRLVKLSNGGRKDAAERREVRGEMRRLAKEERRRQSAAAGEVLDGAAVTCCTLTGVHSSQLRGRTFDVVVIDEAAQATEVACWGALLRGRRAVLAGDHLQLPPTVLSDTAATGGLATTLFERLHRMHPHAAHMLTTQYRMHASIMTWASNALYHGRLRAHASVASHTLTGLVPGRAESKVPDDSGPEVTGEGDGEVECLMDSPLMLVDTAGCGTEEQREEEGGSWFNVGEVECVAGVVAELQRAGVMGAHIGIITPYSAQKSRLKAALHAAGHANVEISTVDGFQGREKEALVVSAVRSSANGGVGFVADRRRMNVAVTRARRMCALVADSETLARDKFLKGLVEYFQAEGLYRSAQEFML